MYHDPVLLQESLDGLNICPGGTYVDCTFGGGGHSKAILNLLNEKGRLFSFDQDPDAWNNELDDPRFTLIKMNFRHIQKGLRLHQVNKVDGILADLGVSSHQFDQGERGFSIRFDGPLDMRMNPKAGISAAEWLSTSTQEEIQWALSTYGEVFNARKLAVALYAQKEKKAITSTAELSNFLESFAPRDRWHTYKAQVFQAIRIVVNQEMEALHRLLSSCIDLLQLNSRLVVISYHSLEDRMVKQFMKEGWLDGETERDEKGRRHFRLKPIHRKPLIPSSKELERNSRSRSAKLRTAKRLEEWV
jgi:16S rRNA (cytosine1402-N4)-methyltransferase